MADAKICAVGDCGKPAYLRGWCTAHYQRWRKHGDPLKGGRRYTCTIDGCGRKHLARGWCRAHYARWQEYGDPLGGRQTMNGDPERYFREVVLAYDGDECLIWPFGKNAYGYARLYYGGSVKTVSRLVCEHFEGPPPTPVHEAAHGCGKGHEGCVARKHLRWDTSTGNHADKLIHGTHNRGERQGGSKLTEDDVRRIRGICGTIPQREIAAIFGIDQSTVSDIKRRKRWAWLE